MSAKLIETSSWLTPWTSCTRTDPAGEPEEAYFDSVIAVAGAFIALPALSLIDEAGPGATTGAHQSHPSLIARCAWLGELALRSCAPNPAPPLMEETIGREIAGDPAAADFGSG